MMSTLVRQARNAQSSQAIRSSSKWFWRLNAPCRILCCGLCVVAGSVMLAEEPALSKAAPHQAAQAATSFSFILNLEAAGHEHSPVWVPVPKGFAPAGDLRVLVLDAAGTPTARLPAQLSEDGQQLVFLLNEPLLQGSQRSFRVEPLQGEAWATAVECTQSAGKLTLGFVDRPVLTYHTAIVAPPEGTSELYQRSGHIHPFITPAGQVVTDEFPSDHLHQHAIFAAWTKTSFRGQRVDFWNQLAGTGTVLHHEVQEVTSGPVFASFLVRLKHRVLGEEPVDVLDEIWRVRLYNIRDVHLFDLESVQTCIADTPLTIDEYHYGGFAFRGSGDWINNPAHQIITNETTDRITGNHTSPNWVAVTGPVRDSGDEKLIGGAMFSHGSNFRSPQPVRLHPSMPYFVYSPCVLGEFDLKPGEPFRSRYRYVAFDGAADSQLLDQLAHEYATLPAVRLSE